MKIYRTLFLIPLLLVTAILRGQDMEPGLFVGGSYYVGDLNAAYHFMQTQMNFGGYVRYDIDTRWAARASFFHGTVKGDDNVSKIFEERGLRFKSNFSEGSAVIEFHFRDYYIGSVKNRWTPFIFGGFGVVHFEPKLSELSLRDYGTEGQNVHFDDRDPYPTTTACFPFGIGFKFSFSKRLALNAEWGLRKMFTDYMDDVSKTYFVDYDDIEPDNENFRSFLFSDPFRNHKAYMQRGNSRTNDWYAIAGVSLSYKISLVKRNKCEGFE